jgi:Putative methyltransferase
MTSVTEWDWYTWHHDYDEPGTALAQRLAAVQDQIRAALDAAPPGPLHAVSLCAGQGRDLIGALARHPRRDDVSARLVELDPRNAAVARDAAAGLPQVEVVTGDAALTDHYAGMVPAYLVLVCGVFGNMTDDDVRRTIGYCTQLCAYGGTVVWTRGRWEPDLVPQICDWFADRGFELLWVSDPAQGWGAGAHRFTASPTPHVPLERGARMFTFSGHHPRSGPDRGQALRAFYPERTRRVPRDRGRPDAPPAPQPWAGWARPPGGRLDRLARPGRLAGPLRLFRDPRGDLGP